VCWTENLGLRSTSRSSRRQQPQDARCWCCCPATAARRWSAESSPPARPTSSGRKSSRRRCCWARCATRSTCGTGCACSASCTSPSAWKRSGSWQLAGGIAHEFNNILTAIVGFGGLLAEHLADDEAAASQVREILTGAERASVLTRDLLAFSRRQVLRPAWIDPKEVVEHLARMLRGVMGSHIALTVRCAERVPPIHADRAQLEQAITTLAIAARSTMAHGGELTIELDDLMLDSAYCDAHISARPGRHVRLAMSDTGQGIPRDLLPRVFEPFFSASTAAGMPGLGLSTVYGIIKQTGGNIWAYSEAGVGTTFKLYFPTNEEAAADPPHASAAVHEVLSGSETILLVDDTDIVRRLARDVLSTAGYRVLEANGADEALQVAGAQPAIDLLVTDVVMPGRSGIELADRLRSASIDVRVLYISGYTDAAIVRNGLLAEEAAFLQKPFTPQDLLRKVRQVLEAA
jgi:two-component system, cell cycle sensor histidine kinase and response regulator CckA